MRYIQQQPHPNLKDSIRCYWKLENDTETAQVYTILPDGFFDLLLCYHDNCLQEVLISGLWNRKTNVMVPPKATIYGVQFRLLAMETLIQTPISAWLNNLQKLENSYFGCDEVTTDNDQAFFADLNQRLLSRLKTENEIDPRKSILLRLVNQTKGNQTVAYYSQQAHWSKRQINRYFQTTFGLSLKAYCGIRRGAAAYSEIRKGTLYPQQGYFDQPHFIKEIKKITGFTPKTLAKNENGRFLQFSIIKST